MPEGEPRIFRYVVRLDQGGSPNPFGSWCSLAVCKPVIRRTARVGDWIIGLRSRASDHVVYAMHVDAVLSLGDYWKDPRFRAKRPGRCDTPDNFYRPRRDGTLAYVCNDLHGPQALVADASGRNALVSWRYWYFGAASPQLPTDLVHLVHSGQGHALQVNRHPADLLLLQRWLSFLPKGAHGRPIDARRSAMRGRIAFSAPAPSPGAPAPPRSSCRKSARTPAPLAPCLWRRS